MRSEIYWVVDCAVRPGRFEEFRRVVAPIVAATKQEAGSIAYDYSVNDDKTRVLIYEAYRDSSSIVTHVTETFAPFAEAFTACVEIEGFTVFG